MRLDSLKTKECSKGVKKIIRIEEKRKARGWTQTELGNRLGITQTAVSMYEVGERTPPLPMLIKLAQTFNCTIDDLVDRGDNADTSSA